MLKTKDYFKHGQLDKEGLVPTPQNSFFVTDKDAKNAGVFVPGFDLSFECMELTQEGDA